MSRLTRLLTTGALLLAASGGIAAKNGVPAESGCFDFVQNAGSATYTPNEGEPDELLVGLDGEPIRDLDGNDITDLDDTPTYAGGTAAGELTLASDACNRAEYVVDAFGSESLEHLGSVILTGRGTQLAFELTIPESYEETCVDLTASVSARGAVVDQVWALDVCGGSGGRSWN